MESQCYPQVLVVQITDRTQQDSSRQKIKSNSLTLDGDEIDSNRLEIWVPEGDCRIDNIAFGNDQLKLEKNANKKNVCMFWTAS
jgi:hypothetical protein